MIVDNNTILQQQAAVEIGLPRGIIYRQFMDREATKVQTMSNKLSIIGMHLIASKSEAEKHVYVGEQNLKNWFQAE